MRIIGIKINEALPLVRKTLRERTWYPFGEFREPNMSYRPQYRKEPEIITDLYKMYANQPQVNVSCIVGMNGSGKSSLLDIMYRIINNLSYVLMKKKEGTGRHLSFAHGIDAELYYEVDDKVGCVHTGFKEEDIAVTIVSYNGEKKAYYDYDRIMGNKDICDDILRNFFYTICTNYSIYSFNDVDYTPAEYEKTEENKNITAEWLKGLFHKNDGYQTPIVMTPFRQKGIINVENEKLLANQRVRVLVLLFYSQGRSFIDGYTPYKIHYNLNIGYRSEHESDLDESLELLGIKDSEWFVRVLMSAWQYYIQQIQGNWVFQAEDKVLDMALYYLTFKTFRICSKYDTFRDKLDFVGFESKYKHWTPENCCPNGDLQSLLKEIAEEPSHIGLKIQQCLLFIQSNFAVSNGHASADDLLAGKTYTDYDEVQKILPPSFYNIDVEMLKKRRKIDGNRSQWMQETFRLSQMSSGEKHFLHSMSYVLYHIKNLQSVDADNYRIPFHHVNLVFDEAELYYHPEYQRRFVKRIIDYLHLCNIDRRKIRSINVIIATHSPFILSDVLTENTLYLYRGNRKRVRQQTFGANIYDLLKSNFMLPVSAIGDVAMKRLDEWIEGKENGESDASLIRYIGDRFIKDYYQTEKRYVQDSEK